MNYKTLGVLVAGSFFAGFLAVGAATYQYVDVARDVRTVEATNPEIAIAIAPNIAPTSGVRLASAPIVMNQIPVGTFADPGTSFRLYAYVDVYGNVRHVMASSPEHAMRTAVNIAHNSGVELVN